MTADPATRPASGPAIETVGLARSYAGVDALRALDLTVATGERVSLVGHNGSGKTTLLRLLAGLLEPSSGSATITGSPVGSIAARAAASYISDAPVFYDDLSVREHLDYVARLHGTDDADVHADWLLERLGLVGRSDDLPATFSRGLQQRAAIAIAFVRPFDVLLVDEPFVGLDRDGRRALVELVEWASSDGAAVVIATHDLDLAAQGDRVIALVEGEVGYDGPPDDVDVGELVGWTTS